MTRSAKAVVVAFFTAYLILGLFAYDDYGLSYDESINRNTAWVAARYARGQIVKLAGLREPTDDENRLLTHKDRTYGTFVELPLVVAEHVLDVEDSRNVYLMRHLATFLLSWCAVLAFFLLVRDRHRSWRLGLLGCALLIATPRIFAHSFFNTKDIGFLSLFIIATYTLRRLWRSPTFPNAALHALASAAVITTRIGGVLIPAVTFLVLGVGALRALGTRNLRRLAGVTVGYLALTGALTVAFWPYLWTHPVGHFVAALRRMSHYPWIGELLYMGEFMPGSEVPWHYVPVWMAITIPIAYTLLFGAGVVSLGRDIWRDRFRIRGGSGEEEDLLYLALFALPILSAIVLRSALYDGWRHMYFVYPAFLLVALRGVGWITAGAGSDGARNRGWRWASRAVLLGLGLNILWTSAWMVRHHPHEQVYFNALAGPERGKRFELDYWGLSFRQGLEFLLRSDTSSVLCVSVSNHSGELNRAILPPEDRRRIEYVDEAEATYFLSNYRGGGEREFEEEHRRYLAQEPPYEDLLWSLKVDGEAIMGVYRIGTTPAAERSCAESRASR